jgi:hypothetical protein
MTIYIATGKCCLFKFETFCGAEEMASFIAPFSLQ